METKCTCDHRKEPDCLVHYPVKRVEADANTRALAAALAKEMLRSGRFDVRFPDPILVKCIEEELEAICFHPES